MDIEVSSLKALPEIFGPVGILYHGYKIMVIIPDLPDYGDDPSETFVNCMVISPEGHLINLADGNMPVHTPDLEVDEEGSVTISLIEKVDQFIVKHAEYHGNNLN